MPQAHTPNPSPVPSDLDREIDAVRENLRQLVEQAAGYSGAADDEQTATRIAEQEALLALLLKQRDAPAR
jgi:hypothetical protein